MRACWAPGAPRAPTRTLAPLPAALSAPVSDRQWSLPGAAGGGELPGRRPASRRVSRPVGADPARGRYRQKPDDDGGEREATAAEATSTGCFCHQARRLVRYWFGELPFPDSSRADRASPPRALRLIGARSESRNQILSRGVASLLMRRINPVWACSPMRSAAGTGRAARGEAH
jgi:hypothetical protein